MNDLWSGGVEQHAFELGEAFAAFDPKHTAGSKQTVKLLMLILICYPVGFRAAPPIKEKI